MDLDGPFGTASTGSLMSGRPATITEVKDKEGNSKFIWGKLDRPDILVGDSLEAIEQRVSRQELVDLERSDVLPKPHQYTSRFK